MKFLILDQVYLATKTIMTAVYVTSVGVLDTACLATRAVMKITGIF